MNNALLRSRGLTLPDSLSRPRLSFLLGSIRRVCFSMDGRLRTSLSVVGQILAIWAVLGPIAFYVLWTVIQDDRYWR
jgi:uncharacterized membrane protein YhhN